MERKRRTIHITQAQAIALMFAVCAFLGLVSLKFNALFIVIGLIAIAVGIVLISFPFACVPVYYMLLYLRPAETWPVLEKFRLILLLVGVMGASFVLKVLVFRKTKIIRNAQLVFILGILTAIAMSILDSYYRSISLERFFDMFRILIMVILVAHIVDDYRKFKVTVWIILGSMTFLALDNFFLWATGQKMTDNGGSSGMGLGFMGDGNDFALALNTMLPLAVYQVIATRRWIVRIAASIVTVSFIMSVVATYSRGGLLGTIAVFVMAYWFYLWRSKNWVKGIAVIAVVSIIGFVAVTALAPETFTERMSGIKDYNEDESAMGRLDAWGAGLRMMRDQPLFGVGAGAFAIAYGEQYKPFDAVSNAWREAHSFYVQASAELGLFGSFFVYGLCVVMYRHQRKIPHLAVADPQYQREIHFFADALTTSLVGFLVSGAFLSVTYYPNLYIVSTLTIILMELARKESKKIAEGSHAG